MRRTSSCLPGRPPRDDPHRYRPRPSPATTVPRPALPRTSP